jgi:hypothetical protein
LKGVWYAVDSNYLEHQQSLVDSNCATLAAVVDPIADTELVAISAASALAAGHVPADAIARLVVWAA